MAKKKKSKFGANVVADVERRSKEGSAYGYLNLPKGLTMFKESEGKITLDIIPYMVTEKNHLDYNEDTGVGTVGEPWYKKPILTHRGIGVDNESVICPRTIKKKCPICEHREQQLKDGIDFKEAIKKAQLRNLYLVIPIGHKKYEEEIHLWDISDYLFQEKLDEELSEAPEEGIFPDPEDGKMLKIRFSEETFAKNKYYETSRIDFEERDDQYEEAIIDESPALDEIFTILTYKELEAKFFEMEDEDEVKSKEEEESPFEEEEEESPKRKKKSFKKKKVTKTEEGDLKFEEEEEPEEEDDKPSKKDKEEKPSKKDRKKKDKCPVGHEFGKDWDEYDDCDDCPVFDACGEANED